ncbi:hypothetical protein [Flavobacterium sp. C4GT6]|uniref:hypothetical protein n=1 Tax=Flavobacterium sp. C4GT6 TaxID=3103818 RepID=UPI002ED27D60
MRVISIVMLFLLVSCSSKKIMFEYDLVKSGLSEPNSWFPQNTAYIPTDEERKHFDKVLDSFLKLYKNIELKEYMFEYIFSKNKYGEVEVWFQASYYYSGFMDEKMDGPCIFGDPGGFLHYASINLTRDKAYFFRLLDPQNPFDHEGVKCYFYMNGKTKEVVNNLSMIYDTEIWRDFDFEDWVSVDNADE